MRYSTSRITPIKTRLRSFASQKCTSLMCVFFFNDTATTEIYTLSLHDALPISLPGLETVHRMARLRPRDQRELAARSEEHTSELQSRVDLVCRLLLEKKKKNPKFNTHANITKPHHIKR